MSDQTDPQQARDAFDREEIDAMRQLRRSGETARNIAQTFRTSASIVQRICALDAVPPAPAPAQQVSPNDAAVLRAAIRSLDCGVHHCRYCEAKSPAWEHVQGCAYVESQRHYREAYDIIQRLEAHPAAPAPPRHERQEHAHDFHEFMVCRVCGLTEAAALNECHHCGDDTSVKNNRCWWCLRPLAAASPSAPQGWQPTGGITLIAAERARQVAAEGRTPAHDDTHTDGALALAAAVYALPESSRRYTQRHVDVSENGGRDAVWYTPTHWPNGWEFKRADRIQELVRAGALIAAEIDRLQRLPAPPVDPETGAR